MNAVRFIFVFFSLLLFSSPAIAQQTTDDSDALAHLASDATWLKLLHFDRKGLFTEPRSAVNDPGFFLAEDGAFDPKAELLATLNAMQASPLEDAVHARCRFPARAHWLKQQGVLKVSDTMQCPAWDKWREQHQGGKVGLTFASGYLGNPASFFGHLLLHIKQPDDAENRQMTASYLLDSSLNFGADVPNSDGMLPYMVKGLFGGYQARYSEAPFYRNTSLYSETQMRDSWFYELDLAPADQTFLIAHLYEVLGQNFDYLFLSQNCASRIARTIELVIDDDLTDGSAPWVSPEQVIRSSAPYARDAVYYPSRRRMTETAYHELSATEQNAAAEAWSSLTEFSLSAPALQALPLQNQAKVIDVLLSHALFIQQSEYEETGKDIQHQLLQARLALPAQTQNESTQRVPEPPHTTTPSASIRLGASYSDAMGEGLQLSFRPLQYDLIESTDARMPFAALEIMKLDVDIYDSRPRLAQLLLFDITNLNALQTGLPMQRTLAWQAKARVQRQQLACRDCLDMNLHLNGGQSWQLDRLTVYALAGGILRTTGYQDGPVALELQTGALYDWSENSRTMLSASYQNAGQGASGRTWGWQVEHRMQISKHQDVRLKVAKDRSDIQVGINFGLYW